MAVLSYEDASKQGPGTLLLVTHTELAIARKAMADAPLAESIRLESASGRHENVLVAHALLTFSRAARLPEWVRGPDGTSAATGGVLSGTAAIDGLIRTFGMRNLTRRIWIDAAAEPPRDDGRGKSPESILATAAEISRQRHVQKDLRRFGLDAESFSPRGGRGFAAAGA